MAGMNDQIITLLIEHGHLGIADVKNLCGTSSATSTICWTVLNAAQGLWSHKLLREAPFWNRYRGYLAFEQAVCWLLQSPDNQHNLFWSQNPHKAETIDTLLGRPNLPCTCIRAFVRAGLKLSDNTILQLASFSSNIAGEVEAATWPVNSMIDWMNQYRVNGVTSGLSKILESICAGDVILVPDQVTPDRLHQLLLINRVFDGRLDCTPAHVNMLSPGQCADILRASVLFSSERPRGPSAHEFLERMSELAVPQQITSSMLLPILEAAMQVEPCTCNALEVILRCWPHPARGMGPAMTETIIRHLIASEEQYGMKEAAMASLQAAAHQLAVSTVSDLLAAAVHGTDSGPDADATVMLCRLPAAAQIPLETVAGLLAAANSIWKGRDPEYEIGPLLVDQLQELASWNSRYYY